MKMLIIISLISFQLFAFAEDDLLFTSAPLVDVTFNKKIIKKEPMEIEGESFHWETEEEMTIFLEKSYPKYTIRSTALGLKPRFSSEQKQKIRRDFCYQDYEVQKGGKFFFRNHFLSQKERNMFPSDLKLQPEEVSFTFTNHMRRAHLVDVKCRGN